ITCASAIGYYGDRKAEILDENSKSGKGFLSECSILWEDSSKLLEGFSQTMNILRIGIVLSTKDGALPKMLMTKSVGMLNYFGNGKQYYSWIHIDDLVKIFIEILAKRLPSGIINAVALTPITNKNMMYQIAEKLGGIPLVMSAPEFAIRLGLGEMADVVLNSNRVIPRFLEQNSFQWQ
ncbi:MAG TPA: DUF1731 domain-containing protein, partial [Saprospiraceae bacterium]|nr:DUF1731 domain-containing protein [Saprospiraceae bacterium]